MTADLASVWHTVGLDLRVLPFSYDQLYVSLSRVPVISRVAVLVRSRGDFVRKLSTRESSLVSSLIRSFFTFFLGFHAIAISNRQFFLLSYFLCTDMLFGIPFLFSICIAFLKRIFTILILEMIRGS